MRRRSSESGAARDLAVSRGAAYIAAVHKVWLVRATAIALVFASMPRSAARAESASEAAWPSGTHGIVSDATRIVDAFERAGWFLDEQVYDETEPMLLESICRATPEARAKAMETFARGLIGEPLAVYRREGGRMTGAVDEALTRHRRFTLVARSVARAESDCPFWILPDPGFEGRQTERNKWVLHLEGGGIGQLRLQQSEAVVGAGGNGRLLLGRGFGDSLSVLLGGELGGGALLKSTERGQFTIAYFPAVPLVVRYHRVAWLYDLEVAPVALFESSNTDLSYGARIGAGVGLSVLRIQNFLPWAGVAASYEHYFAGGGRPATEFLRIGARVGFRWLP